MSRHLCLHVVFIHRPLKNQDCSSLIRHSWPWHSSINWTCGAVLSSTKYFPSRTPQLNIGLNALKYSHSGLATAVFARSSCPSRQSTKWTLDAWCAVILQQSLLQFGGPRSISNSTRSSLRTLSFWLPCLTWVFCPFRHLTSWTLNTWCAVPPFIAISTRMPQVDIGFHASRPHCCCGR